MKVFGVFVALFILAGLLLIASIILRAKPKKIGKIPAIITSLLFLVGAVVVVPLGNQPVASDESTETVQADVKKEPKLTKKEELDELRKKAEDVDFAVLNVDDPPISKPVKATGQVAFLVENEDGVDTFLLGVEEEDGGYGVYNIQNFIGEDVKEGATVTVYGYVTRNADDGMPQILAGIIE